MFILISSFAVIQLVLRKEVPNACCQQGVVCLELCKPQATQALIWAPLSQQSHSAQQLELT